jgi:hypothetical protein
VEDLGLDGGNNIKMDTKEVGWEEREAKSPGSG